MSFNSIKCFQLLRRLSNWKYDYFKSVWFSFDFLCYANTKFKRSVYLEYPENMGYLLPRYCRSGINMNWMIRKIQNSTTIFWKTQIVLDVCCSPWALLEVLPPFASISFIILTKKNWLKIRVFGKLLGSIVHAGQQLHISFFVFFLEQQWC